MDARTGSLLEALAPLPAQTVRLTTRSVRSQNERTFVGPALVDYAVATGLIPERSGGGAIAGGYFVVTAADGMRVAVSLAEVAHGTSTKQVILATRQDGQPLEVGVRLIVPEFPGLAGRSILGVASVEFRHLDHVPSVEASSSIALAGLLDRAGALDTSSFSEGELVEVETADATGHGGAAVPPRHYAGVPVYRLLEAAGIRLDPANHEDFLQDIVVATGADGHATVLAGGEIEPRFMNGQAIVAVRRDGKPLDADEGPARLIVPWDLKPGRWARNLVGLELRQA
jgi:hypothetical protein